MREPVPYTIQQVVAVSRRLLGKEGVLSDEVFVVSNDKPVWRGHIVGFVPMNQANNLWPLVENEAGDRFIVFGGILPYEPGLFDAFTALSPTDAFDLYRRLQWLIDAVSDASRIDVTGLEAS